MLGLHYLKCKILDFRAVVGALDHHFCLLWRPRQKCTLFSNIKPFENLFNRDSDSGWHALRFMAFGLQRFEGLSFSVKGSGCGL